MLLDRQSRTRRCTVLNSYFKPSITDLIWESNDKISGYVTGYVQSIQSWKEIFVQGAKI